MLHRGMMYILFVCDIPVFLRATVTTDPARNPHTHNHVLMFMLCCVTVYPYMYFYGKVYRCHRDTVCAVPLILSDNVILVVYNTIRNIMDVS